MAPPTSDVTCRTPNRVVVCYNTFPVRMRKRVFLLWPPSRPLLVDLMQITKKVVCKPNNSGKQSATRLFPATPPRLGSCYHRDPQLLHTQPANAKDDATDAEKSTL